MWKEAVMSYFRYYTGICLKDQAVTTKTSAILSDHRFQKEPQFFFITKHECLSPNNNAGVPRLTKRQSWGPTVCVEVRS
jgi:hypothetical protein